MQGCCVPVKPQQESGKCNSRLLSYGGSAYVSICQIPSGHLLVQISNVELLYTTIRQLSIYVRGYDAQCQFEKLYETENLFQASLLITQLVCYI